MNNPREKARELVYKFMDTRWDMSKEDGKQCALITVEEVINELEDYTGEDTKFWQEVRNEIIEL